MSKDKKRNRKKGKEKIIRSFDLSRAILPILIGIGVVAFLFFRQFDTEEFARIKWDHFTLIFLALAVLLLLFRMSFYALRLHLLSERSFSFFKSLQLIIIWQFSSAVTPTNVGGSAVALFILSQEKIGAARTTAIVIYTVVLDTFFFLLCIPVWILIFGSDILGPAKTLLGGWEISLITAYTIMLLYGLFFAYGLFVKPETFQRMSNWLSRIPVLRRYRENLIKLGEDVVLTSKALWLHDLRYHIFAILTTIGAWSCRFLVIISLINGFTRALPFGFLPVLELYARIQTMFIIMAATPTPGSAGVAEFMFGSILADYVPAGISLLVASIWRILDYYLFLLLGAIIIPPWLRGVIRRRKAEREIRKTVKTGNMADPDRV